MKAVDRLVSLLILLLGVVHLGVAPFFRGRADIAGLWFVSGGLMLIYLALLNLVRSFSGGVAARWAALAANILALAFMVEMASFVVLRRNPQVAGAVLLVAAATLFSLRRGR